MKKLFITLALLLLCGNAWAADRYFISGGVDNDWSGTDNWSTTDGGGGGASVPGTADTAFFTSSSPNCTLDVAGDVAAIDFTGYTGTFSMSANMTVSGNVTLVSGMTFTPSTNTWTIDGTSTIATGGKTFYNLVFANGLTYTFNSNVDVSNDLTLVNAVDTNIFSGGYKFTVQGNVTATNGRARGNGAGNGMDVELNGTGAQSVTGNTSYTNIPGTLIINKASNTATMTTGIIPYEGITHTAGTVDFTTGSTPYYAKDFTVANTITSNGSINFDDVHFLVASTTTITGNMTIKGLLTVSDQIETIIVNGDKLLLEGGLSIPFDSNFDGTSTIEFSGSGSQNFSSSASTQKIDKDIIFNTSGTVTVTTNIVVETITMTYTAGTVDWTTNTTTLTVAGTSTLDTNGMSFYDVTLSAGTATLSSAMDVDNDLTLSGATLAGAFATTVGGNLTRTGGSATAGTITFDGATTHTIDGTATYYNLDCPTGETCSFDDADIFTISNNCSGNGTWQSDDAVNTVDVDCTAETITSATCIRVDSAGGAEIGNYCGTNTACVNWTDTIPGAVTTAYTFIG